MWSLGRQMRSFGSRPRAGRAGDHAAVLEPDCWKHLHGHSGRARPSAPHVEAPSPCPRSRTIPAPHPLSPTRAATSPSPPPPTSYPSLPSAVSVSSPSSEPVRSEFDLAATPPPPPPPPPPLPPGVHEQLADLGLVADSLDAHLRRLPSFALNAQSSLATLATLNSRQRVGTLVAAHPELLTVPLEGWLSFLTAYGVTRRDSFRLLSSNPHLFTRGSLFNAGNVIACLQSLGLSPRDVSATVIPRCSGLLLLDPAAQLAPAVAFLRTELGLDQAGVRDLLCRCPRVLALDPEAELAPRLAALAAAGFAAPDVRRLVQQNASLLVGDVASVLQARLAFLTAACGFSHNQALAVLTSCPEVLSLTLPNLSRKWRFLRERTHCGTAQVLEYPQFWAKSLLLDIGPRFSYVRERRLLPLAGAPCIDDTADTVGGSSSSSSSVGRGAVGCGIDGACELSLKVLLEPDDVAFVERVWRAAGGSGHVHSAAAAATTYGDGGEEESWAGGEVAEAARAVAEAAGAVAEAARAVAEAAGAVAEAEGWRVPDPDDYERFRAEWLETEGVRWSGVNAVVAAGLAAGSW